MTTLWIEPLGGLAGDMVLAALLDLDDPRFSPADLRALGEELVPGEARIAAEPTHRGSLRATALTVSTPESGSTPHRHLGDLLALLDRAPSLAPRARRRAEDALRLLAEAEARVHGTTVDRVHLHEVGAVDTLIDVAGAALALERLGVERAWASPPLLGSGTVRCAHGTMPVPAPAVAELLRGRATLPGGEGERTTPTGAALLAAWTEPSEPARFTARAIGYGAGRADPSGGPPNVVRVSLGEEAAPAWEPGRDEAWLLELNLDDQPAEEIGHALGALRAAGALEVWSAPVQMKKDRPGVVVSALARAGARPALERAALAWTTTFGLRWTRVERLECGRHHVTVAIAGEDVRVKVRRRPGEAVDERDLAPEHDDLARVAERTGRSLAELRRRAVELALPVAREGPGDAPQGVRDVSDGPRSRT